jgi:hypothetical protein
MALSKLKLRVIGIVALLLFSLSLSLVAAQYITEKTTAVSIGSGGTFSASESSVGVSYLISGTPGAKGSVTAAVYGGNPQADASVPDGVSLTKFVAISFDMSAADFSQATITLNYADSDVQSIQSPYTVYKYVSSTNSYVELPSTLDAAAKTITVTLISIDDPLLAVGGTAAAGNGVPVVTWVVVIVSVVVIVFVAVFLFSRMRHPPTEENPEYEFES